VQPRFRETVTVADEPLERAFLAGGPDQILFHRRQRSLAYATVAASLGVLVLSIWHCSTATTGLTSGPIYLAMPLAVAADAGLVCCKLALLVA